jgi:D-methionine transport system ATP-binding protein
MLKDRSVFMIDLVNVRKSFGDLEVLKDINLHINKKEIYGIIGQSGAGKSTLLRCINGLETYDSGTITVGGKTVDVSDKQALRELRKNMGMIFQNFNLLSRLDVYDNVALPLRFWGENPNTPENKKKIEHLIELVGLKEKIHERPGNLSGGQKQRVAIARALVNDPKILLCDEATSALDPRITHGILELLKQINEELGITIVVVTHQMEVVKQICERVAFLKHGVVLAEGKPEELFVKPTEDIKKFLGEEGQTLPTTGVNIQLFFTDDSSDEPVITEMARELGIDFSICWAKLEEFRENVFGSLILNIQESDKDKVFEFLKDKKVTWEEL